MAVWMVSLQLPVVARKAILTVELIIVLCSKVGVRRKAQVVVREQPGVCCVALVGGSVTDVP